MRNIGLSAEKSFRKFSSETEEPAVNNTNTLQGFSNNFRDSIFSDQFSNIGKALQVHIDKSGQTSKSKHKTVKFQTRDQSQENHIASLEAEIERNHNKIEFYKKSIVSFVDLIQENSELQSIMNYSTLNKKMTHNVFEGFLKNHQQTDKKFVLEKIDQIESKVQSLLLREKGRTQEGKLGIQERFYLKNQILKMKYELRDIKSYQKQTQNMKQTSKHAKPQMEEKYKIKLNQCYQKIARYQSLLNKLFNFIQVNIKASPEKSFYQNNILENQNIQNMPINPKKKLNLTLINQPFQAQLQKENSSLSRNLIEKDKIIQNLREEIQKLSEMLSHSIKNRITEIFKEDQQRLKNHEGMRTQRTGFLSDYQMGLNQGRHNSADPTQQGRKMITQFQSQKRELQQTVFECKEQLSNCQKYFKKQIDQLYNQNKEGERQLKEAKIQLMECRQNLVKKDKENRQYIKIVKAAKVVAVEMEHLYKQYVKKTDKERKELKTTINSLTATNLFLTNKIRNQQTKIRENNLNVQMQSIVQ